MKRIEVTPSILSADFRILEKEVKDAEQAGADRIHCDVMDGHFVPNITFGPLVIEAVKKSVSIPLDVHLMITNPGTYVDSFCSAGSDILTVHAESVPLQELKTIAQRIRSHNVKPGVTVNPDKGIDLFLPILDSFDQVLIMSVYAGFGGQKFIHETLGKMKCVWDEAQRRRLDLDIQVDGGVNHETALMCAHHGANVLVAGSYVFGSGHYRERIEAVRNSGLAGQKLLGTSEI